MSDTTVDATPKNGKAAKPVSRGLAERMAAVMGRLVPPPKNGKMVLQGKPIPYVANDDLMDSLRPAMAAEGVAWSVSVDEVRKGLGDPIAVLLSVRLASAEETLEAKAYGEGRTFPIAQTYAVKYWLLRTFLVGAGGEDDEVANAHAQDAAEKKVSQNGTTRPAPATSYRDDEGRKALFMRCWKTLVATFAGGAPAEHTTNLVRTALLGLHADHPDMLPLAKGEPDLKGASNDQLQRILAWAEAQGLEQEVPF